MIEVKENETRIEYLIRVLDIFMETTIAGEETIDFDGTTCDGSCLKNDIAAELGIDVD